MGEVTKGADTVRLSAKIPQCIRVPKRPRQVSDVKLVPSSKHRCYARTHMP